MLYKVTGMKEKLIYFYSYSFSDDHLSFTNWCLVKCAQKSLKHNNYPLVHSITEGIYLFKVIQNVALKPDS